MSASAAPTTLSPKRRRKPRTRSLVHPTVKSACMAAAAAVRSLRSPKVEREPPSRRAAPGTVAVAKTARLALLATSDRFAQSRHGGQPTCHSSSGAQRACRVLAALAGLARSRSPPRPTPPDIANPYDCAPQPALAQTFAAWSDFGHYTPVPNAGVENGATGWTLDRRRRRRRRQRAVEDRRRLAPHSLDLPAGSSAVTAPICIDETYPHFRLFARNTGSSRAP